MLCIAAARDLVFSFVRLAAVMAICVAGSAFAQSRPAGCAGAALFDIEAMRNSKPGQIIQKVREVDYPKEEERLSRIWEAQIWAKRKSNLEAAIIHMMARENGMIYDIEKFRDVSQREHLSRLRVDNEMPHLHAARLMALREGREGHEFYDGAPYIYGQLYFLKLIGNENFSSYINRYLDEAEKYTNASYMQKWKDELGPLSYRAEDPKGWAMEAAKRLCECNNIEFYPPED